MFKTACYFLTSVVVTSWVSAETTEKIDFSLDSLEYQFEIRRHEALSVRKIKADTHLNEFTSDGCSGGLSVGWEYMAGKIDAFRQVHGEQPPWESCCISHDRLYHAGGGKAASAEDSFNQRREADQALRDCVLETAAGRSQELGESYGISRDEVVHLYSVIGGLMYRAVRVGGMPCTGLPWRWGYGWPECQ